MSLTFKNQEVLDKLTQLCEKHLVPPTFKELAVACGFKSPHSVTQHLGILVKAGEVELVGDGGARCFIPVAWKKRIEAMTRLCAGVSTADLESGNRKLA